jgi:hypothetical protein
MNLPAAVVYSVTINIEDQVHQDWLEWMSEVHIPEVMKTGYFLSFRFLKLMTEQPDATGTTYSVQYYSESMEDLNAYLEKHAKRLQAAHSKRYAGNFVAFRTILQEVDCG